MKIRSLFALVLLLLMAIPICADPPVVSFTATVTPQTARVGEVVKVDVIATIADGYHTYSVVPQKDAKGDLLPVFVTDLKVSAPGTKAEGGVRESTPIQIRDKTINPEAGGTLVNVHEKTATFMQFLRVGKNAKPGVIKITTAGQMQVCKQACTLKRIDVAVPALTIEAGAARPEYTSIPAPTVTPTLETPTSGSGDATAPPVQASGATSGNLGAFLLTAFGAGLLALVTPCVFPMVPVTLAFFTKQATSETGNTDRRALLTLAGVYSLGIIIAFTALGAVAAAAGLSANGFAANPWTNLVFALLFFVFALALLEVVELRPPAVLQRLTQGRRGGTLGVLFMGLTFVIAAFTCTAPFIGSILVVASQAQSGVAWVRPIVGMAAFASALALPFFLLALFPGLLARLPKSGAWLTTVKGALGFVEIIAALKFFSNADLVWQWRILTQPVLLALWAVVALAGSLWLLGVLRIGINTPEGRPSMARTGWATVFALAALYCFYGMTGRPLYSWMAASLPKSDYGVNATGKTASDELPYLASLEEGQNQARAKKQLIFVDFTGYTCYNCRLVEQSVFPALSDRLQKMVRVRLITDNQKNGSELRAYQKKTFNSEALPLYAVLDATGKPIASYAPANPSNAAQTTAEFKQFLDKYVASVQTVAR